MINFKLMVGVLFFTLASGVTIAASAERIDLITSIKLMQTQATVSEVFMPENTLHLRKNTRNSDIDEALFNEIVDNAVDAYMPIVSIHGATLNANKYWTNNTVNASAAQYGNYWVINMYGGLARAPEVTPDGFALVVCHEIGHHLGGFPFYVNSWASSEGQSDYFAVHSCARLLWENDDNSSYEANVHPTAKTQCDNEWGLVDDRQLCYRTASAGLSLGNLLAALRGNTVDFDTPDTNVVSSTSRRHPAAQCRLDTYLKGALCNVRFDLNVIPGSGATGGSDSLYAEKEAALQSCTVVSDLLGVPGANEAYRPRCWYAPKLNSNNIPN